MTTIARAGSTLTALNIPAFLLLPAGGQATALPGPGSSRLVLLLLVGLFVLACAVGVLLALRTRGNRKRWPPRRPATYVPGSWDQSW